ncbi:putrescine aminotransferase, partial [Candidatus Hakubella thermalkaliphila]
GRQAGEGETGRGGTGELCGGGHGEGAPDSVAVCKSRGGGGMPVSAFWSTEGSWQVMMEPNPFIHTTTTGGGPLACSAAIAAINVTLEERLWEQAAEKGTYFKSKLQELATQYPQIYKNVTGKGLLIGQHFHNPETGYKVAAGL